MRQFLSRSNGQMYMWKWKCIVPHVIVIIITPSQHNHSINRLTLEIGLYAQNSFTVESKFKRCHDWEGMYDDLQERTSSL
jgi:hypothetical protein